MEVRSYNVGGGLCVGVSRYLSTVLPNKICTRTCFFLRKGNRLRVLSIDMAVRRADVPGQFFSVHRSIVLSKKYMLLT